MVDVLGERGHTQRMGDDDDGVLAGNLAQGLQQGRFALEIQVVARLVEDEHRGVAQKQLGQAQFAQLARRQACTPFAQHGLVALGQAADKAMRARQLAGGEDLAVIGIGADHAQNVYDGAAEPVGLLGETAHPAAQVVARELRHVVLVDRDRALGGLVQAGKQLGQGGFARAIAAQDGMDAARSDLQRYLVQRQMARRVLEAGLL